jgi:hypothetical protein
MRNLIAKLATAIKDAVTPEEYETLRQVPGWIVGLVAAMLFGAASAFLGRHFEVCLFGCLVSLFGSGLCLLAIGVSVFPALSYLPLPALFEAIARVPAHLKDMLVTPLLIRTHWPVFYSVASPTVAATNLLQLSMGERKGLLEKIGRARAWNILLAVEQRSDTEFAALLRSISARRVRDFLFLDQVGSVHAALLLSHLPVVERSAVLDSMDSRRAWDVILLGLQRGPDAEFVSMLRTIDRRRLESLLFLEPTSRKPAIVAQLQKLGIEIDVGRVLPTTSATI